MNKINNRIGKALELSGIRKQTLGETVADGTSPRTKDKLWAICVNDTCNFTTEVPKRTTGSYCRVCGTSTVVDVLTLCVIPEASVPTMYSTKRKHQV